MIAIRESTNGCTFPVRLQPRSRRNRLSGVTGDAVRVAVTAPPVDGQANAACCQLLAEVLRVPKSSVSIAAGQSSRNKLVRVTGLSAAELLKRLRAAIESQ